MKENGLPGLAGEREINRSGCCCIYTLSFGRVSYLYFFWHKAVVALLFLLKLMEQSTPSAGLCKYEHSQSHKRLGSTQRPSLIVPRKCWILVTVVCVRACMSRCIHMLSRVGELADHASNPESLLWRRKLTLVWIYNQLNLPCGLWWAAPEFWGSISRRERLLLLFCHCKMSRPSQDSYVPL